MSTLIARSLAETLLKVQNADTLGRDVTLIAVSKGIPVGAILEAYDAGQRDFGESRLQEALPKIEVLPQDITWHFIGKLQSNKARAVAQAFQVIHSLDSESQLRELSKIQHVVKVLIEVNIGEEPQKSGISPKSLDSFAQKVIECKQVQLKGLMTVGPANPNAELMRPYFTRMRELAGFIGKDAWLSMGMSNDFEVAIQEGATHVRVGSAIFGSRTER